MCYPMHDMNILGKGLNYKLNNNNVNNDNNNKNNNNNNDNNNYDSYNDSINNIIIMKKSVTRNAVQII